MKRWMKAGWGLIAMGLLMIPCGIAQAEETEAGVYGYVDFFSNYVWRGQKLSDSWVIQPAVGGTYAGFGAEVWANYDIDESEHTETDFTLSYTHTWHQWTFEGGYIYYLMEDADDTQEVYASVSWDVLLTPSVTCYYDFDEGDGGFMVVAVGHSFEFANKMLLNLGASVGINLENELMGTDEDGDTFTDFYNAALTASLTLPLHEHITVEPKVGYSFALSDKAKEAISAASFDEDKNVLYGGVNVTVSF